LGRDPFEESGPLTIRVSLRRAAGGSAIIADVSKTDADGQVEGVRSVTGGDTCETLDEALTLVVALMLDGGNAEHAGTLQPNQPAETETVPERAPAAATETEDDESVSTAPDPERVESEPGHLFLSAGIGTSFGLLPFPSFGVELQLAAKPRGFWGFQLSTQAFAGSSVDLPESGSLGFRMLSAGAALCPLDTLHDGLWLSGCAGGQLAWLQATNHGLTPPHQEIELVVLPSARVQLAQQLSRGFYLGGALGLVLPISPNHYTFRDVQGARHEAFQMASPSLTFGILLAFRPAEF